MTSAEMSRAWSFLQTGGMSQFQGNLGYTDRVDRFYEWDSTVPNHALPETGDVAVLRDSDHLLGLGWIASIDRLPAELKLRRRCPRCGTTDFKRRSSLRPPFRCGRCRAEFDRPVEEEIGVTRYVAHYGTSWWPLPAPVAVRAVAGAYRSRASQHSIRELGMDGLRAVLAHHRALPPPDWWAANDPGG